MACLLVMCVVSYIFIAQNIRSSTAAEADILLSESVSNEKPSLTVVTRIAPSTYYLAPASNAAMANDNTETSALGAQSLDQSKAPEKQQNLSQPHGFEYQLLSMFAEYIGYSLNIVTANSLEQLFNAVDSAQVDFASAALTPTASRAQRFQFSAPYLSDQAIVVYRVGKRRPRSAQDLIGHNIVVTANSSHSQLLREWQNELPELHWREIENVNFVDLLGRVERDEVDYTIIDSSEFMLHRGSFPTVKRAFDFGDAQPVSWMFAKTARGSQLREQANAFISVIEANGTLAKLEERYFGQSTHVDQVAAYEFAKNVDTKLNNYIDIIQTVADEAGMDWRLLAAMSYQESGWDPTARSRTGVRGMMMLTRPTARELGVKNRLDLLESLQGGARYYLNLKERLPESIKEPDRSWFALAAYNVGFGHLEDARVITQTLKKDPNSWLDVKQALPLLTKAKWYRQARYGYARGYEPVQYVQQIRHYQKVLMWNEMAISIASNSETSDSLFDELKPVGESEFQWSSSLTSSGKILASGVTLAENSAIDNSLLDGSLLDNPLLENNRSDVANERVPSMDAVHSNDKHGISPSSSNSEQIEEADDAEQLLPKLTLRDTRASDLSQAIASR